MSSSLIIGVAEHQSSFDNGVSRMNGTGCPMTKYCIALVSPQRAETRSSGGRISGGREGARAGGAHRFRSEYRGWRQMVGLDRRGSQPSRSNVVGDTGGRPRCKSGSRMSSPARRRWPWSLRDIESIDSSSVGQADASSVPSRQCGGWAVGIRPAPHSAANRRHASPACNIRSRRAPLVAVTPRRRRRRLADIQARKPRCRRFPFMVSSRRRGGPCGGYRQIGMC